MRIVRRAESANGYIQSLRAKNWLVFPLYKVSEGGPFTYLNKALAGAEYPPITLIEGAMEYYILEGEFLCNNETFKKGDYVRFESDSTMHWSSQSGGEIFFVLNGKLKK